jgi:hypothetical protein
LLFTSLCSHHRYFVSTHLPSIHTICHWLQSLSFQDQVVINVFIAITIILLNFTLLFNPPQIISLLQLVPLSTPQLYGRYIQIIVSSKKLKMMFTIDVYQVYNCFWDISRIWFMQQPFRTQQTFTIKSFDNALLSIFTIFTYEPNPQSYPYVTDGGYHYDGKMKKVSSHAASSGDLVCVHEEVYWAKQLSRQPIKSQTN